MRHWTRREDSEGGVSARIRFDKSKMSGWHEQALRLGLRVVFIRRLDSIQRKIGAWSHEVRFGRGERIRTSDPCVPNAVRYRAALRPDKINRTAKRAGIVLHQRVETQAMGNGHLPTVNLAIHHVHTAR